MGGWETIELMYAHSMHDPVCTSETMQWSLFLHSEFQVLLV
jgi:hypothetical protein